jgi:hypothetical protein
MLNDLINKYNELFNELVTITADLHNRRLIRYKRYHRFSVENRGEVRKLLKRMIVIEKELMVLNSSIYNENLAQRKLKLEEDRKNNRVKRDYSKENYEARDKARELKKQQRQQEKNDMDISSPTSGDTT